MSEKKNLESIRFLAICLLIINVISNILFFTNNPYIPFEIRNFLNLNTVVNFNFIPLIAILLASFFNFKLNVTENVTQQVNSKSKFLYLPHIIFIFYIFVSTFIIRNKSIIISSLTMEITFIAIHILTRKCIALGLSSRQYLWRKTWEVPGVDVDKDSNFTWRLKFWISPHVNVEFNKRWKKFNFIYLIFAYIFISKSPGIVVIFLILSPVIPIAISWIEALLGLHTSLTGLCTAITQHTYSRSSQVYYKLYITDFQKEREITFCVDNHPYIEEGSEITVIHGIFSKKVIYIKGLNISIR
ncbi:MAG: hypothetical protein RR486_05715 [Clostridium sp.]|uniref:hypothetical protein n=1 Tax=Clostridium sp. TaxID=1506 RepID=UPI00304B8376